MADDQESAYQQRKGPKLERVEFKVTPENKLLIRLAAGVAQEDYSTYARRVCLEHARRLCAEHGLTPPAPQPSPERASRGRRGGGGKRTRADDPRGASVQQPDQSRADTSDGSGGTSATRAKNKPKSK